MLNRQSDRSLKNRASNRAAERVGGALFRYRSWTPWLPLALFAVLAEPTPASLLAGAGVMFVGEALRVWANAHIGGVSRTRGDRPGDRLVRSGPFAYMRNPLYAGNLFLTLGAAWMSGRPWFAAAALLLFAGQYGPVVRWEESRLRERFGASYEAYCAAVPRWFPRRFRPARLEEGFAPSLRRALSAERRTFLAVAAVAALFALRMLF